MTIKSTLKFCIGDIIKVTYNHNVWGFKMFWL